MNKYFKFVDGIFCNITRVKSNIENEKFVLVPNTYNKSLHYPVLKSNGTVQLVDDYNTNICAMWNHYESTTNKDYLYIRDKVNDASLVEFNGWVNLEDEEKDLIIKLSLYLSGPTDKVIYLMGKGMTQSQAGSHLYTAYSYHNVKEVESCIMRSSSAKFREVVLTFLLITDAADFAEVIQGLEIMFSKTGVKGVNDGISGEGLFDWVESTPGTSFENGGLEAQGYVIQNGLTIQMFIGALMDVLRNGNY